MLFAKNQSPKDYLVGTLLYASVWKKINMVDAWQNVKKNFSVVIQIFVENYVQTNVMNVMLGL